ncbi:MAG: MCE family protein [Rubrivivax sp.]|nr:MCE family protein [Rubrivivax sp.]
MKGGAPWRVGLFALVGLGLLALAVVLAGGHFFVAREGALMRFTSSVYGLQVGAPVVFRGVRVGQVTAVDLAPAGPGGMTVPVTAEFERSALRALLGGEGPGNAAAAAAGGSLVRALVARGLVARLATQSLLTGQLYVDLDIEATRVVRASGLAPAPGASSAAAAPPAAAASARVSAGGTENGLPVVPTAQTQLQSLQAQLEGLDLGQIGRDMSALTSSMRQLLGGPEPARALARVADAAEALRRLAERLEREVAPLSRSAQVALGEGQRAAVAVGQGASQLAGSAEQMAQQVAAAASQVQGQVGTLSAAGTAALAQVQRSADAVAQAAESLRAATGEDSGLRIQGERALADVSRAARALRDLAELLERHPEALLRGRASPP